MATMELFENPDHKEDLSYFPQSFSSDIQLTLEWAKFCFQRVKVIHYPYLPNSSSTSWSRGGQTFLNASLEQVALSTEFIGKSLTAEVITEEQ